MYSFFSHVLGCYKRSSWSGKEWFPIDPCGVIIISSPPFAILQLMDISHVTLSTHFYFPFLSSIHIPLYRVHVTCNSYPDEIYTSTYAVCLVSMNITPSHITLLHFICATLLLLWAMSMLFYSLFLFNSQLLRDTNELSKDRKLKALFLLQTL